MSNHPSPSDTVYCRECGQEILPEDQFCSNCGTDQSADSPPQQQQSTPHNTPQQPGKQPPTQQPPTQQQPQRQPRQPHPAQPSPLWPIYALVALWVGWIGVAAAAGTTDSGTALLAFIVLGSLPILYIDAKNAAESNELDLSYPIAVPLATLLLWILALPAYLIYRWTQR